MHIRLSQPSDIPTIAEVNSLALCDDPLIASLAPRRHEHWEEFVNQYVRRNKGRFYTAGRVLWVAVTDEEDGDAGKIVGHAVWRRDGEGEDAKRWGEWIAGGKGGWLWHRWCGESASFFSYYLFTYAR